MSDDKPFGSDLPDTYTSNKPTTLAHQLAGLGISVRFNTFSNQQEIRKAQSPRPQDRRWKPLQPEDRQYVAAEINQRFWMENEKGARKPFVWSDMQLTRAMTYVCNNNPVNPPYEYLNSLSDRSVGGTEHLNWLGKLMGFSPDNYLREATSLITLGCILRVDNIERGDMVPQGGLKHYPVLVGNSDAGKSRALWHLLPPDLRHLYGSVHFDTSDMDRSVENFAGSWLVEMSEVATNSRAKIDLAKTFFSTDFDKYRQKYDKLSDNHRRTWMACGTTNNEHFIPDDDGLRNRFVPVSVEGNRSDAEIADFMDKWRDNIWASAFKAYQAGSLPNMSRELNEQRKVITNRHTYTDPAFDAAVDRILKNFKLDTPMTALQIGQEAGAADRMTGKWSSPFIKTANIEAALLMSGVFVYSGGYSRNGRYKLLKLKHAVPKGNVTPLASPASGSVSAPEETASHPPSRQADTHGE